MITSQINLSPVICSSVVVVKIRKRNTFGTFVYKRVDESDEDENEDEDEENGKERSDATAMTIEASGRPIGRFRFQTPPPVQLTPKGLTLEIVLKHYSRHQVKPKAMFTFQCMKVGIGPFVSWFLTLMFNRIYFNYLWELFMIS